MKQSIVDFDQSIVELSEGPTPQKSAVPSEFDKKSDNTEALARQAFGDNEQILGKS